MKKPSLFLGSILAIALLAGCSKKPAPIPEPKPTASLTWEKLLPDKPSLPEGEVGMDLVLLRVPMATASAALLQDQGGEEGSEGLLKAVLDDPATSVITKASVVGPQKEELHFKDVKNFIFHSLYSVSFQWQEEQTAQDRAEKSPGNRQLEHGKQSSPIGTQLDAVLERDGDQLQANLAFEWRPEPLKRPCNSWPVKEPGNDFIPLFQPWTFNIHYCLSDAISLLAANPEAPGPDGPFPHSGFMLMAFGRARSTPSAPATYFPDPRKILVRSWTYEVPAAQGEKLLRSRTKASSGPSLLRSLAGDPTASLISCSAISSADSNPPRPKGSEQQANDPFAAPSGSEGRRLDFRSRIESALHFEYPAGFEGTVSKEFRVVCDEMKYADLAHKLEIDANLFDYSGPLDLTIAGELPATSLHWKRWHGSSLGSKDEPAGVETPVFGEDKYNSAILLNRGASQLTRARMINDKMRLTFVDWIRRDEPETNQSTQTLRILETPLHPWFERLAQPNDPTLSSDLDTALDTGTAHLLKLDLLSSRSGQRQSATIGDGYLFIEAYLNTSIRGEHLFYNPRFVAPRTSGLRTEIDGVSDQGLIDLTARMDLSEPVGTQRYALWLPNSPLHSRQNSGIDRPIILNTMLNTRVTETDGRDYLLGTCLVPTSTFRKEPTLRWFILRGTAVAKKRPAPRSGGGFIEFTILASDASFKSEVEAIHPNPAGTLLAEGMVFSGGGFSELSSGLTWDSPEPRDTKRTEASKFDLPTEKIPEGTVFAQGPDLLSTPCGLTAKITPSKNEEGKIEQEKWTATYLPDPRIITDTLMGSDSTPSEKPVIEYNIPVSCERAIYEPSAKAEGTLPDPGMQMSTALGHGRLLIVRHHAAAKPKE